MGDRKKASRKRAIGTREHIIAYLTGTGELFDPGGMASTRLASAWAKHGELAEENARLREQLRAAEQSLTLAWESLRRLPVIAGLDSAEVTLLRRLLAPAGWEEHRPVGA